MEGFDIWFDELSEEKQKDLLDFYGIENPKEMNWDVFPVTTVYRCEAED